MLTLLGWLAVGTAAGLAVRALGHSRAHLGVPRAVGLGWCGAAAAGLAWVAVAGLPGLPGGQALVTVVAAAVGGWVLPWAYLAYTVRWEPQVAALRG